MNEMQSKGQYDALYIFAKMMTDGAFLFVAQPKVFSTFLWDQNKLWDVLYIFLIDMYIFRSVNKI